MDMDPVHGLLRFIKGVSARATNMNGGSAARRRQAIAEGLVGAGWIVQSPEFMPTPSPTLPYPATQGLPTPGRLPAPRLRLGTMRHREMARSGFGRGRRVKERCGHDHSNRS